MYAQPWRTRVSCWRSRTARTSSRQRDLRAFSAREIIEVPFQLIFVDRPDDASFLGSRARRRSASTVTTSSRSQSCRRSAARIYRDAGRPERWSPRRSRLSGSVGGTDAFRLEADLREEPPRVASRARGPTQAEIINRVQTGSNRGLNIEFRRRRPPPWPQRTMRLTADLPVASTFPGAAWPSGSHADPSRGGALTFAGESLARPCRPIARLRARGSPYHRRTSLGESVTSPEHAAMASHRYLATVAAWSERGRPERQPEADADGPGDRPRLVPDQCAAGRGRPSVA